MPTTKRSDDWRQLWANRKATFARETWQTMMQDMAFRRMAFYYTPTTGNAWGELHAVPDGNNPPDGSELVTAEWIPAGTVEQIQHYVNRHADWLKVIPENL